ncbi:peptide alpha-N-acetyltransferase complex B subunit [Hanseniaspora uvarum]|nr:peptide alpha-N-acetyltransferase complex B subunit [Hanseniaspora uvarum]
MSSLNPFEPSDLFHSQNINLDPFVENFPTFFYLEYLILNPNYVFKSTETLTYDKTPKQYISGYIIGKVEGSQEYHSHISALAVDNEYRRIRISSNVLLECFKNISDYISKVKFIDLFVKCDNKLALNLYENIGYSIYRRVIGYYDSNNVPTLKNKNSDTLDAFDMRLCLSRDNLQSMRNGGPNNRCLPSDVVFK